MRKPNTPVFNVVSFWTHVVIMKDDFPLLNPYKGYYYFTQNKQHMWSKQLTLLFAMAARHSIVPALNIIAQ